MADLLNPDALHHNLDQLDGWHGTTSGIHKTYRLGSDQEATTFVEQVAALAERMNHHPEVTRVSNTVSLELVTHSAGGVTQKDVDFAERIDQDLSPQG